MGEQHQTVKAILERGLVSIRGLNRVLSCLCMVYRNGDEYEFPFLGTLVAAGAEINAHRILDDVSETNTHLVSTLIELGADLDGGWDYRRQMLNSPLHGIFHMNDGVFNMLIGHGTDVKWGGGHGFTAMMELMSSEADASNLWAGHHEEKFQWLVGAGASCLIGDDLRHRVSDTVVGRKPAFRELIKRAIGDENWGRRRALILLRFVPCPEPVQDFHKPLPAQSSVDECDPLVLGAATMDIVGVFRQILSYL